MYFADQVEYGTKFGKDSIFALNKTFTTDKTK